MVKSKECIRKGNFEYKEINLDDDEKRKEFYDSINKLSDEEKINSVPQIYINNKRVGGFKEFNKIVKPF